MPWYFDEERFWAKVQKTEGCWEWRGRLTKTGYGKYVVGLEPRRGYGHGPRRTKDARAHRVAWYLRYGEILDPDSHLDHLCRNRRCVRPDHLQPVDSTENARRRWKAASCCPTCGRRFLR